MLHKDLVIIGGGPAGLMAALRAAESNQKVLLIERNPVLGGQLIKQTHKFFGSEKQNAKMRGFQIAQEIIDHLHLFPDLVEWMTDTTVVGLYPDYVITCLRLNKYFKIQAKAIIIATGASEKVLAFENSDLPGIYGAGAVQTVMNVHHIRPGNKVIMVGSGNIGLIVSYQLLQAGVKVCAVIEAAPSIGGYKVHAAKLRRLGVPILTSCTILKAIGTLSVEQVELVSLDEQWNVIANSNRFIDVDTVCIAVGLTPLSNLLAMMGAKMNYIPELGGNVALIDEHFQTTIKNIYCCGDVSGIEEASSAIIEGSIAGLEASFALGQAHPNYQSLLAELNQQLKELREGPFGEKIRKGINKMEEYYHAF